MQKKIRYIAILVTFMFGLFSPIPEQVVQAADFPDLAITNVTLDPASPNPNETFDVNVTFENQGLVATADKIFIDVYVNGEPTLAPETGCPISDGDYDIQVDYPGGLAPSASVTETVTIENLVLATTGLPPGAYDIWVFVVDGCSIQDSDVSDNLFESASLIFGTPIKVTIGGIDKGTYYLSDQSETRVSYAGVDSGPVLIASNNGTDIIASERIAYIPSGTTTQTDYSEIMGIPLEQLETTYWFPVYDNVSRNTALSFGNAGNTSTTITITIGGVVHSSYVLAPSQSVRPRLTGVDDGPVKVESSGGVPIIVSERFAYTPNNGVTWNGFSETNGLPDSQLSSSYIFSWYNNVKLNTQLRFGNVGNIPTKVTVTIGGIIRGEYDIEPNKSVRVSYPNVDSGPVLITSNNGVDIVASERIAYIPSGTTTQTSYSEIMGIPLEQLETTYWFPVYDNVSRNTALSFGNVGTTDTTITVTIGGVVRETYTLAPNQSIRPRLTGVDDGPVKVESSGGVPIIVSERFAYTPNNGLTWTGFSETNGLPDSQLSSSYIFSWYNNVKLNTQLRFGIP